MQTYSRQPKCRFAFSRGSTGVQIPYVLPNLGTKILLRKFRRIYILGLATKHLELSYGRERVADAEEILKKANQRKEPVTQLNRPICRL